MYATAGAARPQTMLRNSRANNARHQAQPKGRRWPSRDAMHLTAAMPKHLAAGAAAGALIALTLGVAPAPAYELEATPSTFSVKCAGCHQNGGNVLAVGATLFPDDLARNGVLEPDALYSLIYKGKGKMPGFGQECAPRGQCTFGKRLSDAEVQDLVTYVLERAQAGWK